MNVRKCKETHGHITRDNVMQGNVKTFNRNQEILRKIKESTKMKKETQEGNVSKDKEK